MSKIPTSQEKIQELCDILERDALQPAKQSAQQIISKAKEEASQIIADAKVEAQRIEDEAKQEAKKAQSTLEGALNAAARQALTQLRKEIETRLLDEGISSLLSQSLSKEEVITSALRSLFQSLEKEGLSEKSLHVLVEESLDREKILESVLSQASPQLKKGLSIGSMNDKGVVLRLEGDNISIDCSEEAVSQLFCQFLRPAFREKFFSSGS